jgi:hypothetical protein
MMNQIYKSSIAVFLGKIGKMFGKDVRMNINLKNNLILKNKASSSLKIEFHFRLFEEVALLRRIYRTFCSLHFDKSAP